MCSDMMPFPLLQLRRNTLSRLYTRKVWCMLQPDRLRLHCISHDAWLSLGIVSIWHCAKACAKARHKA